MSPLDLILLDCYSEEERHTSNNHELTAMLIGESMFTFAGHDMSDDLCDVLAYQSACEQVIYCNETKMAYTKSHRSKFMICPNRKG
jgi:hypothetical protein